MDSWERLRAVLVVVVVGVSLINQQAAGQASPGRGLVAVGSDSNGASGYLFSILQPSDPGGAGGVPSHHFDLREADLGGGDSIADTAKGQAFSARSGSDGAGGIPFTERGSDGGGGIPASTRVPTLQGGGGPDGAGGVPSGKSPLVTPVASGDSDGVGGIPSFGRVLKQAGGPDGVGDLPFSVDLFVRLGAGSDGVAWVPLAAGSRSHTTIDVSFPSTASRVVDRLGAGIPQLTVAVTSGEGHVVATGMTDSDGFFVMALPMAGELELAVIGTGVADVPVAPGVPVLIVLP